ncbi:MAG: MFS transporter, partial [Patescibacteria group bacterium]
MVDEFKPLIRNSRFIHIWTSQILSQLTIHIMNFLLLIRLFAITGSTIATSLLWVAYALPAILIGPIAAASVDMVDRRKMLMITNLAQSLTIFTYAFLHETRFFLLYGIAFIYSLLNQFYVPAEAASIPSVVSKKYLAYANGLFFLTQQGALVLGFGVAGILNQVLGYTNSLYLCAAFLFVAFVSVSFLPQMKVEDEVPRGLEEAIIGFFTRISEGYYFIKEHRYVFL